MKLKFWQKTYLLTLLLFLICLSVGILSMAVFTYRKEIKSAQNTAQIELLLLANAFEQDCSDLDDSIKKDGSLLIMEVYGSYYKRHDARLLFTEGDEELYNSFEEIIERPSAGHLAIRKAGTRYILITYDLCDGKYRLTYGKNIDSIDREFKSMLTVFLLTDLGVSLLLAVCLFWVLRKLAYPLERLQKTTEMIATGNYECLAEQKGSDEFAKLADSFNAMVRQIRTQMNDLKLTAQQKQGLVDNLAHELRTPLTSIRGYAEYLQKATLSEEEKIDAAGTILSEAERLQHISEKLLDSAFIRNNEIKRSPVSVYPLMSSVAEKLMVKANCKGVNLQIKPEIPDGETMYIMGDAVLLDMLLYNLTDNAIKSCVKADSVTIGCRKSIEGTVLFVNDTGKGMTDEQLQHITEPFYRTDKSRSRADGGTGLGLSLCLRIVESHGGVMRFFSKQGVGTTVTVIL